MRAKFEFTEADVKKLIIADLESKMGKVSLNPSSVLIEVKSKQNYKSEWEAASFRASYEGEV